MTHKSSSPAAPVSRRSFLKAGAGLAAGTVLGSAGVQTVTTRLASAGTRGLHERSHGPGDYGPLRLRRAVNQPAGPRTWRCPTATSTSSSARRATR